MLRSHRDPEGPELVADAIDALEALEALEAARLPACARPTAPPTARAPPRVATRASAPRRRRHRGCDSASDPENQRDVRTRCVDRQEPSRCRDEQRRDAWPVPGHVAVGMNNDANRDRAAAPARAETGIHAADGDEVPEAQRVQSEPACQLGIRELDVGVAEHALLPTETGSHHAGRDDVRDRHVQVRYRARARPSGPAGAETDSSRAHRDSPGTPGPGRARVTWMRSPMRRRRHHRGREIDQQIVDAAMLAGHSADGAAGRSTTTRATLPTHE